ncbi:MAG: MnhB domain-containing protein [Rhodopila sp.]
MNNTPDSPAKPPDDRMDQGGNYWTLFTPGIWKVLHAVLEYMAGGARWVETRLRIRPVRWMGFGLLLACGTGAGAWLFGRPLLTSYFAHGELLAIGAVPLASVLLFDLGVFALVVGATVLMLIALAHQSVRSHRLESHAQEPEPRSRRIVEVK